MSCPLPCMSTGVAAGAAQTPQFNMLSLNESTGMIVFVVADILQQVTNYAAATAPLHAPNIFEYYG